MGWEVSSRISGGRFAPADPQQYERLARALHDEANCVRSLGLSWEQAMALLQAHRHSTICPILRSGNPNGATDGHITLPYDHLGERCGLHAKDYSLIGGQLDHLADLLIRAHSLYSQAEDATRRMVNKLVEFGVVAFPKQAALVVGGLALGGIAANSAAEGRFNAMGALTTTAWAHEGLIAGIGVFTKLSDPMSVLGGNEVNSAASKLSKASKPIYDAIQGDVLDLAKVEAKTQAVGQAHSVSEAMEGLRRLGEERLGKVRLNSGLSYATIAVQRYRRMDGSASWLVTIPGTDGKADSPFGWPQNAELMSGDRTQRMQADSARMVAEAMRQSGIGEHEPVALIGHSQGGIVAATIASDLSDHYDIEHVVTAGSPIANHPIPAQTWVTSVEMDDEVVAALDGAPNPTREHWLTVRGIARPAALGAEYARTSGINPDGSCTPGNAAGISNAFAAAPVEDAGEHREISHWLKYHQAAYRNATDLGSPALEAHERHFRQVINGSLEQTVYWQGRMSHG